MRVEALAHASIGSTPRREAPGGMASTISKPGNRLRVGGILRRLHAISKLSSTGSSFSISPRRHNALPRPWCARSLAGVVPLRWARRSLSFSSATWARSFSSSPGSGPASRRSRQTHRRQRLIQWFLVVHVSICSAHARGNVVVLRMTAAEPLHPSTIAATRWSTPEAPSRAGLP